MVSARTVEASSAHEATRPGSEAPVRASEIPVVLSLESPKIFVVPDRRRGAPNGGISTVPAPNVFVTPAFVPPLGGPSDRGLAAMTTSTKR